jgi:uncharacterized protein
MLLLSTTVSVALNFPELTGRVVDEADLLSPAQETALTDMLEKHERKTSNQVVVVTVTSLQGISIESFGRSLGNHWGIGQKDKDNGVLLIVAPEERRVRIEVGRGLEGKLTNRIAKDIIDDQILPKFKAPGGDMASGIRVGTITIIEVLEDRYQPSRPGSKSSEDKGKGSKNGNPIMWVIYAVIGLFNWFRRGSEGSGGGRFSGGGGSFGGGGASGGW